MFINHSVYSEKYQYIGDCHEKHFTITFFCVKNYVQTDYFSEENNYYCNGNFVGKQFIDVIKFKNCEHLQIPNNLFRQYINLNNLDLSNLGLEMLRPENFTGAEKLKQLSVAGNKFSKFPLNLYDKMPNLEVLDLSNNQIEYLIPDDFRTENNLKSLNVSCNNINELPVNMSQKLTKLETLDFSRNNISKLSNNALNKFTEMKKIYLSYNEIADIPSFMFHNMKYLDEVDCSHNKITKIGYFAFSGVTHLKKLLLAHNQLKSFDRKIFDSDSSIEYLDVSFNQISNLKMDTLAALGNLEYFDMTGNPFQKLKNEMFENNSQLKTLSLSQCGLSDIEPGTFSSLDYLEKLDLSYNQLKTLDRNILPTNLHRHFKIIGIDSNKFNCTYLDKLIATITPQYLDVFLTDIKCDLNIEEAIETTTFKSIEKIPITTAKAAVLSVETTARTYFEKSKEQTTVMRPVEIETTTQKTGLNDQITKKNEKFETTPKNEITRTTDNSIDSTLNTTIKNVTKLPGTSTDAGTREMERGVAMKLNRLKHIENENHINFHDHSIAMHNKLYSLEKYLITILCVIIIGFSIIALSFAWIIFRTRCFKKFETANVFYRQSEPDLSYAVENNQYGNHYVR